MNTESVAFFILAVMAILIFGAGIPFLSGYIEGRKERKAKEQAQKIRTKQPENRFAAPPSLSPREEQLISEISDRSLELERIRFRKALPVEKVAMKLKYRIPIMWFVAVVTLIIALVGIGFTDPRSRGYLHILRESIAWTFGLFYFLYGGIPITAPSINVLQAFWDSPQKSREFPLFIWLFLPFIISIASVIVFFYGYLGRHF